MTSNLLPAARRSFSWCYPRSLKHRLLLAFFLGSLIVTMVSGWFVFRLLSAYAQQEFDAGLADKLRFYQTVPYINDRGLIKYKMGEASLDWEKVSDPLDPDLVQMTLPNERIYKYATTKSWEKLPLVGYTSPTAVFADCILPDGKPGRAGGLQITIRGKEAGENTVVTTLNIVVAKSRNTMLRTLVQLQQLIIQAAVLGIGGLLLAATYIIRRGTRSVARLEKQISEIPVAEKGGRFSLPGAPSEVQTVVNRLNELMNRVDEALEHERTFTSNAAHELRTPLAGMKTHIEVALTRTRTVSEYEDTLYILKDMQGKLQQLVENLLLLARLESGQKEFAKTATNLRDILRSAWKPFFDKTGEKELSCSIVIDKEQATAIFPTTLLEIVLRNLLQNALDYTPSGGKIVLTGSLTGLHGNLQVRNTNPGLTQETAERVFQPFWRADLSGDPNQHNAGIGLALCKRIMQVIGGEITVSITPENQVQFECTFPVEPNESPALPG